MARHPGIYTVFSTILLAGLIHRMVVRSWAVAVVVSLALGLSSYATLRAGSQWSDDDLTRRQR